MKAGQGDPRWPAFEGETVEAYLRRLAVELGREIKGPPLKPMPADNWSPYREDFE